MPIAFPTLVGHRVIGFLALAAFVAVPCLGGLAYRGWAKHAGKDMSYWRNVIGLISIVAMFFNWLSLVAMTFLALKRFHTALDFFDLNGAFVLLSLIAAGLCFALKKAPRVEVLIASGLMAGLWLTSVVE
jgi:hypothetical protein